jgi:hypothetical protein
MGLLPEEEEAFEAIRSRLRSIDAPGLPWRFIAMGLPWSFIAIAVAFLADVVALGALHGVPAMIAIPFSVTFVAFLGGGLLLIVLWDGWRNPE